MEVENNVFRGKRYNFYLPTHIISNSVTFFHLLTLIEGKDFRQAMMIFIMLNDAFPAFIW